MVYIGTYTRQNSKGIYAYRFQPSTGKLTEIGLAGETSNPSFLAVHPNKKFLYAANENSNGTVSAFSIDAATGKLTLLNQVSSKGSGPCHVALDKTGKWLFVANYNNGSAAAYPVQDDGKLGEATATVQHAGSSANRQRQSGPHAHSANLSPDGKFVLYADLGLDQILAYRLDPTKGMDTANPVINKVAPGSGPRHFAFGPKGKFAYVCNEIADTVTVFSYEPASGTLKELQTVSMVPKDYTGAKSAAEIFVHPNGKFLYASNRGHDSIVVFAIDGRKGTLTPVDWTPTQGKTPRNFAIDPTGGYLFAANQDAGGVVLFKIDKKTGKLTATGDKMNVPFPVCVVFR
ncbi:MAG TPA: lactonase family protein [Bryobacteraceae bacterium]|nr:lactonase family protein [Bryobacteraceae bacterium]